MNLYMLNMAKKSVRDMKLMHSDVIISLSKEVCQYSVNDAKLVNYSV